MGFSKGGADVKWIPFFPFICRYSHLSGDEVLEDGGGGGAPTSCPLSH